MVFREEKLSDGMLKQLVSLSSDWEAEQSCYGYRKNEMNRRISKEIACLPHTAKKR